MATSAVPQSSHYQKQWTGQMMTLTPKCRGYQDANWHFVDNGRLLEVRIGPNGGGWISGVGATCRQCQEDVLASNGSSAALTHVLKHVNVGDMFACTKCPDYRSATNESGVRQHAQDKHGDRLAVVSRVDEHRLAIDAMHDWCFPKSTQITVQPTSVNWLSPQVLKVGFHDHSTALFKSDVDGDLASFRAAIEHFITLNGTAAATDSSGRTLSSSSPSHWSLKWDQVLPSPFSSSSVPLRSMPAPSPTSSSLPASSSLASLVVPRHVPDLGEHSATLGHLPPPSSAAAVASALSSPPNNSAAGDSSSSSRKRQRAAEDGDKEEGELSADDEPDMVDDVGSIPLLSPPTHGQIYQHCQQQRPRAFSTTSVLPFATFMNMPLTMPPPRSFYHQPMFFASSGNSCFHLPPLQQQQRSYLQELQERQRRLMLRPRALLPPRPLLPPLLLPLQETAAQRYKAATNSGDTGDSAGSSSGSHNLEVVTIGERAVDDGVNNGSLQQIDSSLPTSPPPNKLLRIDDSADKQQLPIPVTLTQQERLALNFDEQKYGDCDIECSSSAATDDNMLLMPLIRASEVVLIAHSRVLGAMLTRDHCRRPLITIPEYSFKDVYAMVKFCHTLALDDDADAHTLLRMAIRFDISELKRASLARLKAQMSPTTAVRTLLLASDIEDEGLKTAAIQTIIANIEETMKLTDWVLLNDKPHLLGQLLLCSAAVKK